jgi:hypothetical protein
MKPAALVLLLMASLAFVLLGCTDNPSSPVSSGDPLAGPSLSSSSSPSLAKSEDVKHSVNGNVQLFIVKGPGFEMPIRVVMTFSAKESKDGTVSGTFHYNYPGGKDNGQGKVVGLKVDGNKAKLEFLYNTEPFVGKYGFVVVIDNGEGKNSPPDQVTAVWVYEGEEPPYPQLAELFLMDPDEFIGMVRSWVPFYIPQETGAGSIQVR